MSRDISKVSEAVFLSSKPIPYLPYLDEDQRGQAWFYKIKRKFFVWQKYVKQRRPLLEGIVQVERLLTTRKRDGVSKIDMHVRTTSTVILTCYNSIIKQ